MHLQPPPTLWSIDQQLSLTNCAHKSLVHKYSDLNPTIPYHKVLQYKMKQCWQRPTTQPAIGKCTTTKYREQCNCSTGSSFPNNN